MPIKRSNADISFSLYIRSFYKCKCQRCGKQLDIKSKGLHCSHHTSRNIKLIRYDTYNALALCYSCHEWFSQFPLVSGDWVKQKYDEYGGKYPENYQRILNLTKSELESIKNKKKSKPISKKKLNHISLFYKYHYNNPSNQLFNFFESVTYDDKKDDLIWVDGDAGGKDCFKTIKYCKE